jgi:hypothetical protein
VNGSAGPKTDAGLLVTGRYQGATANFDGCRFDKNFVQE